MAPDSRWDRLPIESNILLGFCVLFVLILAPILLSGYLCGSVPASHTNETVHVKILAINDFHGQLPVGQTLNNRQAGSIPVLASYLKSSMASMKADGIIIALPGLSLIHI